MGAWGVGRLVICALVYFNYSYMHVTITSAVFTTFSRCATWKKGESGWLGGWVGGLACVIIERILACMVEDAGSIH